MYQFIASYIFIFFIYFQITITQNDLVLSSQLK